MNSQMGLPKGGSGCGAPDGRRAATFLTRGGGGILIVDLERGTLSQVSQGGPRRGGSFPIWTHDGARVVYSGQGEVFWTPADGSGNPELLASEPQAIAESTSPDGRTLVAISIDGGEEPRWSRNPQELFFRNAVTNQLMAADIATAVGSEPGRPRALVALGTSLWDVAPDGKRFLVVQDPDPDADAGTVQVVVNWLEELKRLVPTK